MLVSRDELIGPKIKSCPQAEDNVLKRLASTQRWDRQKNNYTPLIILQLN